MGDETVDTEPEWSPQMFALTRVQRMWMVLYWLSRGLLYLLWMLLIAAAVVSPALGDRAGAVFVWLFAQTVAAAALFALARKRRPITLRAARKLLRQVDQLG